MLLPVILLKKFAPTLSDYLSIMLFFRLFFFFYSDIDIVDRGIHAVCPCSPSELEFLRDDFISFYRRVQDFAVQEQQAAFRLGDHDYNKLVELITDTRSLLLRVLRYYENWYDKGCQMHSSIVFQQLFGNADQKLQNRLYNILLLYKKLIYIIDKLILAEQSRKDFVLAYVRVLRIWISFYILELDLAFANKTAKFPIIPYHGDSGDSVKI